MVRRERPHGLFTFMKRATRAIRCSDAPRENRRASGATGRGKNRDSNPFVGEPVGLGRVSDPGEHGREPARSPNLDRPKHTEVGDVETRVKGDKVPVNTSEFRGRDPPRCGEGCGDTLSQRIFIEKGSNLFQ